MRGLVGMLMLCACFNPIAEVTRPFDEAARAREAAKWAGTYAFSECAGAGQCWRYIVTVGQDGSAIVSVEGDEPTRVNAKPRVNQATLTLQFESYADGGHHYEEWIPAGLGPAFRPGERLAKLVREVDGSVCLRFDRLASKLDTSQLCARAEPPR